MAHNKNIVLIKRNFKRKTIVDLPEITHNRIDLYSYNMLKMTFQDNEKVEELDNEIIQNARKNINAAIDYFNNFQKQNAEHLI